MHRKPARSARKAAELHAEGRSSKSVAQYFNDQGFASASGKSWTHSMVQNLLTRSAKAESNDSLHRDAIVDARARGLSCSEMAEELNKKNIRRRGGLRWTAHSVELRWRDLERAQRKREQKESANREESHPVVLKNQHEHEQTRIILRRSFVNIARRLLTIANIFARALTSCRQNLRGEANPTCNSPYRLTFSQPNTFCINRHR